MTDERVDTIRCNLKKMRNLGMDTARVSDEIHSSAIHWQLMNIVDLIDDAMASNDDVDTRLRLMEAAYDSDTVDTARRERRR